ncbi:MAG: DUF3526 domain-containing protein [Pseudomonadota bacterium]
MTASTTVFLERRLFLLSTPGLIAGLLIGVLALLATFVGQSNVSAAIEARAEFAAKYDQGLQDWRSALEAIENGASDIKPTDARPMNLRFPAVMPPGPLADFVSGRERLHPSTTVISGWSNPASLFTEYEFDNPTPLSIGNLDLSFLVVALMPLIMIAVSFDILAADRERGRARITAVQSGALSRSIWERLVVRNLALWAVLIAVTLIAVAFSPLSGGQGERIAHYFAWLATALLYGVFWFGLIAAASALFKRSETVASTLFAVWAAFLFAVPAIGGALAEGFYPPPSRLAFLSEMREGEVIAVRETASLTAGFLADHPDMTVSDEAVPGYYRSSFLANTEASKRTTPILEEFEESRRRRDGVVRLIQFASPSMIVDRALAAFAGGDLDRAMDFQRQAFAALDELHRVIGPVVVAKQRLSLDEFDALPPFSFEEASLAKTLGRNAVPLLYLAAVGVALMLFARRRLGASLEKLL